MNRKVKKFILLSAISMFVFTTVTSSVLYNTFRRAVKKIPIDFKNWGEE